MNNKTLKLMAMDANFINETAQYIQTIIKSGAPISWSWGVCDFKTSVYKEMAALQFNVSGFIHKGKVIVAYDRGSDAFEVYCLDDVGNIIDSRNDVYFNELIDTIDGMVEKKCSKAEYNRRLDEWLKENRL